MSSVLTEDEKSELLSLVDGAGVSSTEELEEPGLFDNERVCCGRLPAGPYNVFMTALVLFFAFASFNPVQSMQTTLYPDDSYLALGILYAFLCLFNIFASGIVKSIGEKWAMVLGGVLFFSWMANQVVMLEWIDPKSAAHKALYFGTSALMGIGGSLLYTSQGSFVALNAPKGRLAFFMGVFFCIYFFNYVVGGLILQFAAQNEKTLMIVLVAISLLSGAFLFLLYQPVRIIHAAKKNYRFNVLDTLRMFAEPQALLLSPLFLFSGLSSTYYYGVLASQPYQISVAPENYVMGYCLILFGIGEMIASFGAGAVIARIGIYVTFIAGVSLLVGGLILSYFANVSQWFMFLLAYALVGAGDAVMSVVEYTALGTYFPHRLQAAYAFLRLFIAFGTAAGFGISLKIVTDTHPLEYFLFLLGGVLAVAVASVTLLHVKVAPLDGTSVEKK
jgi:MFS family permease